MTTQAVSKRRARRSARRMTRAQHWRRQVAVSLWSGDEAQPVALTRMQIVLWHLLPLTLYASLALIATYPLVLHFTTHVPSVEGDALMNLWGYWWTREALFTLRNPFETPYIYAPTGAPLYLHTLNLYNGLVTIPFQLIFGLTVAYNILVILSFALAGYFAYLLAVAVSGSRAAGIAGGAIYAFSAYQLMHLLGHTNLLSSQWLPAYLLCLLRALASGGRRRTIWSLLATGALVLVMLCDWQYVVFAILATVVLVLWHALTRRSLAPIVTAGAIGVLWLILAMPLLVPTIAEASSGIVELPGPESARIYSADLFSFTMPSTRHWLWGAWATDQSKGYSAPYVEGDIFLGYLALALGLLGIIVGRRRAWPWVLLAAVFVVLSFGPYLHIGGQWVWDTIWQRISMPFLLLQNLPGFNFLRVPIRMVVMVNIALAVLASLALAWLFQRWPRLRQGAARALLLAVLIAVMLVEQLTIPVPLQALTAPPFYQALAQSPEQGVILEWPFSLKRAMSDYYQTIHHRPIIGGYIARRLSYPLRLLPPVGGGIDPTDDIITQPRSPNLGPWSLQWAGVRWIVVYRNDPLLDRAQLPDFLSRNTDGPPIYEDEMMAVYRPKPPTGVATQLQLGPGWYELELSAADKRHFRWFATSASFWAWHFGAEPGQYRLRFDAVTFAQPRRLEVRVDGQSLGEWRVADTQLFDIPVTLTTGRHQIELRALDPPISPASVGRSAEDTRPLAFAIANARLALR